MSTPRPLLRNPAARSTVVGATTASGPHTDVIGLIAHAAGNFVGQLSGDSANRTIVMAAGQFYPIRVKSIDATSAIAVTLLHY